MQIKDSVFLIPGGVSGLGAATAKNLLAAGGKVVVAVVNQEAGEKFVAGLGPDARFVVTDVTNEAQVQLAVDTAVQNSGTCTGSSIVRRRTRRARRRQERPAQTRDFQPRDQYQPDRQFQHAATCRQCHGEKRAEQRRRARRDHQYGVDCGVRRAGRSGRLQRVEGRDHRDGAADRARAREAGHTRDDDCAGHIRPHPCSPP